MSFTKLKDGKVKVYCAKLKREEFIKGLPRTVYKVGTTAFANAEDRFEYNAMVEDYPISSTFPDIKIMHTVICEDDYQAKKLEAYIMHTIKGNEVRFHNWYEPDQISGITEMRSWDYEEFQKVVAIMNQFKDNKEMLDSFEFEYQGELIT